MREGNIAATNHIKFIRWGWWKDELFCSRDPWQEAGCFVTAASAPWLKSRPASLREMPRVEAMAFKVWCPSTGEVTGAEPVRDHRGQHVTATFKRSRQVGEKRSSTAALTAMTSEESFMLIINEQAHSIYVPRLAMDSLQASQFHYLRLTLKLLFMTRRIDDNCKGTDVDSHSCRRHSKTLQLWF